MRTFLISAILAFLFAFSAQADEFGSRFSNKAHPSFGADEVGAWTDVLASSDSGSGEEQQELPTFNGMSLNEIMPAAGDISGDISGDASGDPANDMQPSDDPLAGVEGQGVDIKTLESE